GSLARAGHPAQRGAAVEAAFRSRRHRRRRHQRRCRAVECAAGSPPADSRTRGAAGQEADGDRDPAGGAGGRKKKSVVAQRVRTVTQHPVATICRTLRMARQTAYYAVRIRPGGFYRRLDDETVLQQIRAVTNSRATYGYRRVWAMVNRTFRASYNRKRIRRLMRMHGLMLPPRVQRRHGQPHLGQVQQPASNQRWCSDIFLIPCWSGEVLSVAFAIDCHDREVFAWTASPRPLNGGDIRSRMCKAARGRVGGGGATAPPPSPVP